MKRNWVRYLTSAPTNAGRAIVEQGRRISEAKRTLATDTYLDVIARAEVAARDARTLIAIGNRLGPLLDHDRSMRFPIRLRTLSALADLSNEALLHAAEDGLINSTTTEAQVKALIARKPESAVSSIQPTDNWNFATLRWPRIDDSAGRGYVPGDLYANCLWYYAENGDVVVDPMAGSGMLMRVWEDRESWVQNGLNDLTIILSDLSPRGPYKKEITACNLLKEFPVPHADYIIVDPPYVGLVESQYSDSIDDLANMKTDDWITAIRQISNRFHAAQTRGGRCTIVVPNNREITTGKRTLFPEIVRRLFHESGYELYDVAYTSRRTQRTQGRRMGILNNRARRERVPLTDIAEVLTFHIP